MKVDCGRFDRCLPLRKIAGPCCNDAFFAHCTKGCRVARRLLEKLWVPSEAGSVGDRPYVAIGLF